ncbi:restriction endonuclease subunit S [Kriegella aquimaris]|uniref:Type I restriction enzyme, S subunit n=1 Tax=Kriegella aquimaris TaxID=192904 RepID=A0A1G9V1D4_9FLAO|nr:restriction endonuclease subunit S [Kriegella aquimaris]SDM65715.1 type I restriction enzyme, S subunit [Kriegella aquimaris]
MATENKSPEVRFEGFNDKWKKNYLEDEIDFYSGLTYSPLDVQKGEGTFVIRSSNVKNSELVNADDVFVNPEIVNCLNVEKGDIAVVVRNGSRSLIGKHAQIKEILKNTVIGAFMTGLRPKNNSDFINALLDTQTFQKEIQKNLGATINQITTGPFKKMEFFFPNIEEQKVVGDFFKNLNKSISVSKIKLTKLKNLKKAMLVKMFPQEGATIPEIRFKGFDGEWEDSTLDNEVHFFSGLTYSPLDVDSKADTLVLRSSNVKRDEIIDADNVYVDSSVINCTYVEVGDIVVVVRNGSRNLIGKHAQVKRAMNNTVIGAFMTGIRAKVPSFLNAMLSTLLFQKQVEENLGATINQITTGVFKNMVFKFPIENEQIKIGQYFENLDNLILNHNEQLKKLNSIKKACLSKMFVA